MWVLVLVPPLLRSRTDGRPNHSISSFQRQLRTLQRTGRTPNGTVTYLRAQQSAARRGGTAARARQYADDYDDYDDQGYDDGYRIPAQPVRRTPQASYHGGPVRHSAAYAAS